MLKTEIKHRDHIAQLRVQCSKYAITDFKVLTKLGEGQFGTVFLVTDPSKTRFYALKCISKAQTVKNKLEKHLINQKTVMEEMNYYTPFCVNYIRSYKDDNFIYFLMEYIKWVVALRCDQDHWYSEFGTNSFLWSNHARISREDTQQEYYLQRFKT